MQTVDISSLFQGSSSKELQKQFIGSEHSFTPGTTGMGAEWQLKDGSLLDRTAQSQLWDWVQATQTVVTDAEWLSLEAASPNGAVSVYSSGDGGTNFRVPTVGVVEKLGLGNVVESGTTGNHTYEIYEDGTIHQVGREDSASDGRCTITFLTPFNTNTYNPLALSLNSGFTNIVVETRATTSCTLIARNEAGTGISVAIGYDLWDYGTTAIDPNGVYIYTGSDTAGLAPVDTLEQLLLATAQRPITYNNSLLGVVNQRGFDGNWSALSTGDYGYDGWLKYSVTHKAQIVEDGDYMPNTVHIVQYDGVAITTITSPASGHWLIAIPATADNVDIRAGEITVPFYPEDTTATIAKALRYFEVCAPISAGAHGNAGNAFSSAMGYLVIKRIVPTLVSWGSHTLVNATLLNVESVGGLGFQAFYSIDATGAYTVLIVGAVTDASLTIADAGTNITVVG